MLDVPSDLWDSINVNTQYPVRIAQWEERMWPQRNPISDERPFVHVTHKGSADCAFCQQRTLDATGLRLGGGHGRGKQLGRLERGILLRTARSQAGFGSHHEGRRTPLLSETYNVSRQTALRAAAARLQEVGLVTLRRSTPLETDLYLKAGYETGAVARPVAGDLNQLRRRLAKVHWGRRTLLGDGVVIAYRDALETAGQRLRWDGRLEFALLGAHTRCLCRHSDQFRAEVEKDLDAVTHMPVRF